MTNSEITEALSILKQKCKDYIYSKYPEDEIEKYIDYWYEGDQDHFPRFEIDNDSIHIELGYTHRGDYISDDMHIKIDTLLGEEEAWFPKE